MPASRGIVFTAVAAVVMGVFVPGATAAPAVDVGVSEGHSARALWFGSGNGRLALVSAVGAVTTRLPSSTETFADIEVVTAVCEDDQIVERIASARSGSYEGAPLDSGEVSASDYRLRVLRVPHCDQPDLADLTVGDPEPIELLTRASVTAVGDYTPYNGLGLNPGVPCATADAEGGLFRDAEAQLTLTGAALSSLGLPALTLAGSDLSAGGAVSSSGADDSCWQTLSNDLRGLNGRAAQRRAAMTLARQVR